MPTIYYQEKGNGYPVVLLHGLCETNEIWNLVTDKLSTDFRIIAIDLPGFGRSESLKHPHSIDDVADAVLELLIHKLKLNSCALFGHSLGGYVALSMVEKKLTLFKAIGLVHSTAYPDSEARKQSRNKVIEFVRNHGVKPFAESFIPPLFFNSTNPHIAWTVALASKTKQDTLLAYTEAMRDRPDRLHVVRDCDIPILFLAGKEDSLISIKTIIDQSLFAKRPSFTVLAGVAHMGMLENQDETASVIADFIMNNS